MEHYYGNNFNPYENPQNRQTPLRKQINHFETAAWILGISGILSVITFYGAYLFGALAMLFALLSRGAQMHMSPKAKRAFVLGITAILLTTILFAAAFYYALQNYGSIEGILREYCNLAGYEFEEIFGDIFAY